MTYTELLNPVFLETHGKGFSLIEDQAQAVEWFRRYLQTTGSYLVEKARRELRGKNLACWCKPGAPCHADVLLEIANK